MQIPCVVTMFCAPELRCTLFSQLYDPLVCALHLVFSYQYHHSHQVVSTYCEAAIAYKLNTFKLLVSLDSPDFQGQKKKLIKNIYPETSNRQLIQDSFFLHLRKIHIF